MTPERAAIIKKMTERGKSEGKDYLNSLLGMRKYDDTGRTAGSPAEMVDSYVGGPVRQGLSELQDGHFDKAALGRVLGRIGNDPQKAPSGFDIASKATDNPYLGTALATAVDFGSQLPAGLLAGAGEGLLSKAGLLPEGLVPPNAGIIKGVKDSGKVADASEAFKARGEAPPSTETKIAQMHGQTGDVKDAVPTLLSAAKNDARLAKNGYGPAQYKSAYDNPKNAPPKPQIDVNERPQQSEEVDADTKENLNPPKLYYKPKGVADNVLKADNMNGPGKTASVRQSEKDATNPWHDPNDHRFSDDNKEVLDQIAARYGPESGIEDRIMAAQEGPNHLPYNQPNGARDGVVPLPNFAAKPTGVIGEPRIQKGISTTEADPFAWMDSKYGAGKQLLQKHQSLGKPVTINTSSDLIGRDDYIQSMPENTTVNMHMLTGEPTFDRIVFPSNASNERLEIAVQKLKDAGVKVNQVPPTTDSVLQYMGGEDKLKAQMGMDRAALEERISKIPQPLKVVDDVPKD